MGPPELEIRRPVAAEWPRILEVLETANFHHIGGPEMPSFPLGDCFVAAIEGAVIGVAGYRVLDDTTAKTTLLAVDPKYRGRRAGGALHTARQDYLRDLGIKTLYTNTDDERVIAWYERVFGYISSGERTPKLASFGRCDRQEWIELMVRL